MILDQKCLNHFTSCFCISVFIWWNLMWCKQWRGGNFPGKATPPHLTPHPHHIIDHVSKTIPLPFRMVQPPSREGTGCFQGSRCEERQQRCCVLSCLIRPRDSLGKEEIRCQVRWREGNKTGAGGKGGRGEVNRRGNKVRGRVLEMKTIWIAKHVRIQVLFLSLCIQLDAFLVVAVVVLTQKYVMAQITFLPWQFKDWETSGLAIFFTYNAVLLSWNQTTNHY